MPLVTFHLLVPDRPKTALMVGFVNFAHDRNSRITAGLVELNSAFSN